MALRTAVARRPALRTAYPVAPPAPVRTAYPVPPSPAPRPAPAPAAAPAPIDYSSDPILAQIRALSQRNIAAATAAAGAARETALTRYGTGAAGEANPFSVLHQLAHGHEQRVTNLNEGLNKQNLFYSGHRGQALGEESRTYLGEQTSASNALQDLLRQIGEGLASSQQSEADRVMQAEQDAYARALQLALQQAAAGAAPAPAAPRTATPIASSRIALLRRLGMVE